MKVIIPCKYLDTVRSKPKDGKESCTYHNVLAGFETCLVKDKDNIFSCSEALRECMLECNMSIYNGKAFFTLLKVLK